MKHTAKLFAIAATAAIFLPFSANAALAHEGGVGDGTSVKIRLDTTLPAGIVPNLGNGEAELYVVAPTFVKFPPSVPELTSKLGEVAVKAKIGLEDEVSAEPDGVKLSVYTAELVHLKLVTWPLNQV